MKRRLPAPSFADWVTRVPAEWDVERLGNVAEILFSNVDKHTIEGEMPVRLCNYVDVYKNDRITRDIDFMEASATSQEIARFQIYRDDVLATKDSETSDDIAISSLVVEDLPNVLCGYHLALIRSRRHRAHGPYLAWLHACKSFRAHYEAQAVGVTRFGLSQATFKEARVPLPPLPEQQRIAAYLNASCAAIDAAVVAKRLQLETLDAVRGSLIESAVTTGIRAEPALRRIDADWLREIPAHWEVCRIKRAVLRVDYGISEKTEEEGRFPVLKMGHIQRGELDFSDFDFVDEVSEDLLLEKGDLLYNRTNSPDQVGKAAVFRGSRSDGITFASYLVRLRTNHRADPYFLNYVLNSSGFLDFARKLAIPSVQQSNLNSTRYCRMLIPLPPAPEQQDIIAYLDEKLAELQRIAATIGAQIATLTAYRKSLIHEYVTGQCRIAESDSNQLMAAHG
jgi:type I restriction enzyme S subunit